MFAAGDLVIYGGEGVCRVESVGMPETEGIDKTKAYYTLSPLYRTGQVMTPVDTGVLMRPVMTPAEADAFLTALPELPAGRWASPVYQSFLPQAAPAVRPLQRSRMHPFPPHLPRWAAAQVRGPGAAGSAQRCRPGPR